MKVHIFHTGAVKVDRAVPLKEKNRLAVTGLFRGEKKKVTLPVSSYLIEHEGKKILLDAGWHRKYIQEKAKGYLGMLDKVSKPILKEGESIDYKLEKAGISPTELDYVILSHLDFDHVSGLPLVKEAKCIIASFEELEAAKKGGFRYMEKNWEGIKIEPFYFEEGIGPVKKSLDLLGDNRIILVSTPGHSEGHTSLKLLDKDGHYLILAGDAAYIEKSYSSHTIGGLYADEALANESLDYLIQCRNDPLCLGVYANHDPSIEEGVIEL